MKALTGCVVLVLALTSGPLWAINKCLSTDGRVTYTDGPCASGSTVETLAPPPQPDARAQRDARQRGENDVDDARALAARIDAAAAERQRSAAAAQRSETEAQRLRALQEDGAGAAIIYPGRIFHPQHPVSVKPVLPPVQPLPPRSPAMSNLRFRKDQ